jgi:hypothetical protein
VANFNRVVKDCHPGRSYFRLLSHPPDQKQVDAEPLLDENGEIQSAVTDSPAAMTLSQQLRLIKVMDDSIYETGARTRGDVRCRDVIT